MHTYGLLQSIIGILLTALLKNVFRSQTLFFLGSATQLATMGSSMQLKTPRAPVHILSSTWEELSMRFVG